MAKRLAVAVFMAMMILFTLSGCATEYRDKGAKAVKEAEPVGEAKGQEFVLRINCGASESYNDKAGNIWLADQEAGPDTKWGVVGGQTVDRGDLGMTDTSSPRVYETERYSMEAYKFSVPYGTYTVKLHFAETYSGITGVGQRIFSVTINEKIVLKDFDPFKEAGGPNKPVVKTIKDVAVGGGEIVIGFTSNIQNPEINGIEILSAGLVRD